MDVYYYQDGKKWEPISAVFGKSIAARSAKKEQFTIKMKGVEWTFDPKKMQCKKASEKKWRNLRRGDGEDDDEDEDDDEEGTEEEDDDDAEAAVWEFKSGKQWKTCPIPCQTGLEAAKQKKQKVWTWKQSGKVKMTFNLSKMMQVDAKGKTVAIRRVAGDGSDDDEESEESEDPPARKSSSKKKSAKPTPKKTKSKPKDESDEDEESEEEDEPPVRKSSSAKKSAEPTPKKTKAKSKDESDEDDDEEEDEPPKKAKSAQKKSTPASKKRSRDSDDEDDDDDDKPAKKSQKAGKDKSAAKSGKSTTGGQKMVKKGRGVVDTYSFKQDTCHVYEDKDVWQCILNQTNMNANNNKYYVIQLLEADNKKAWWVFTRWGRIGTPGQTKLQPVGSAEAGQKDFKAKFREKTRNAWDDRSNFEKVAGKYQLMDIDLGNDDDVMEDEDGEEVDCKLDERVRGVMELIADKTDMTRTMRELHVDTERMPLGKISKAQIKQAYGHLKTIESEIKKGKTSSSKLVDASSMFYTLVPHNIGMAKPRPISTAKELREKMELLDTLSDLEVAEKILAKAKHSGLHPLDSAYHEMKCTLQPLEKDSETYKLINQYLTATHGPTHNIKIKLLDAFEVAREGEDKRFKQHSKLDNHTMLWHGSRLSNWMGILSQGLRIAPPEAPVTGYMFGKGVYFADMATKSGNYCRASSQSDVGFMSINQVALGDMHKLNAAQYMEKPPKGTHSTWGWGKYQPVTTVTTEEDVIWPAGKPVEKKELGYALLHHLGSAHGLRGAGRSWIQSHDLRACEHRQRCNTRVNVAILDRGWRIGTRPLLRFRRLFSVGERCCS
ncbi:Poly polymerase [Diplonema papillatum]|nr:Poly polymerase [Diplonema papillatum]